MTKKEEIMDDRIYKKLGLAYYVLKGKPAPPFVRLWYPELLTILRDR